MKIVASFLCTAELVATTEPAIRVLAHINRVTRHPTCLHPGYAYRQCLVVSNTMLRSQGSWCSGRSGLLLVSSPICATERVTRGNKEGLAAAEAAGGVDGLA